MDGNSTICPAYSELDLSATTMGLYSEYVEKENSIDQNKGLNRYKYKFEQGRTKIDVSKERIDNTNTLAYQNKINSASDVSIIEGVTNDLSKVTTDSTIPVTEAAVEYQITPEDKDSGSSTNEKNSDSTTKAMEASSEEIEYSQSVKESQDSIDAQKAAQQAGSQQTTAAS